MTVLALETAWELPVLLAWVPISLYRSANIPVKSLNQAGSSNPKATDSSIYINITIIDQITTKW